MDEYCKLQSGEVFEDFDCLLKLVDEKSDKFYCIQVLKNEKGFHVISLGILAGQCSVYVLWVCLIRYEIDAS